MKSTCSCVHPGQDKLHGKQVRVFNRCTKPPGTDNHRCTVCLALKAIKK